MNISIHDDRIADDQERAEITNPRDWWERRRCCIPCGFEHGEPGPRMDPVTRRWISEPWEAHERGSALAWAMFAATALLLAAFCVLCLAASPRGELARAWIAGLFGG